MRGFKRLWIIDSPEKFNQVLTALKAFRLDFSKSPFELIFREQRQEKSPQQRKLWHLVIGELAPNMHLTPAQCKLRIKALFWGVEVQGEGDFYYALVPSSEEADKEEYSRLIDFTYQYAAEQGFYIPDREALLR